MHCCFSWVKLGHKFEDLHHVLSTHVEYFEYLGQVLLQEKSWGKKTPPKTYPQRNTCAHLCTWIPRSRYWQAKWWTPEVKIEEKTSRGWCSDDHFIANRFTSKQNCETRTLQFVSQKTRWFEFQFHNGWCKWTGVLCWKLTPHLPVPYIFGSRGLYSYLITLYTGKTGSLVWNI